MKYSVIIPVYNAETKIKRCLDSLLSQPYTDYEIVLVNDGSTDKSKQICEQYAQTNPNVKFFDKENGGASSARNAGLAHAEGDYILFVDSDDYVEDNFFSEISGAETPGGLTVFTYNIINSKGKHIRDIGRLTNDKSLFEKSRELILSRTINSPCAKIFDSNVIRDFSLKYDEKMPVAEDFNYCLSYLMCCEDVSIHNTAVYCYDNTNEQSLVKKKKEGLIDIYPYVFDCAYNTIADSTFSEHEKKALFRIWDKLHTDSFATCVMEEFKGENQSRSEVLHAIRNMCIKFNLEYPSEFGYENAVHFAVRFCIKHRLSIVLYYFGKIYAKIRG